MYPSCGSVGRGRGRRPSRGPVRAGGQGVRRRRRRRRGARPRRVPGHASQQAGLQEADAGMRAQRTARARGARLPQVSLLHDAT